MTKFVLDSGNPTEYLELSKFAKEKGSEIWGGTTNPSLIAKQLSHKKIKPEEALNLQKEIVMEILQILPGAVSAEVYADSETTGTQMAKQGIDIASWDKRIVVKIPTTIEGFKARTILRKEKIVTNNTLVFTQAQIFAICLHEDIMQKEFHIDEESYPPFISPFVGRLDDIGINGMGLVKNGMEIKKKFQSPLWMLEASVRNIAQIKQGITLGSELITAPYNIYLDHFSQLNSKTADTNNQNQTLKSTPYWNAKADLMRIKSLSEFMDALDKRLLDISHELTDAGIKRFADDWNSILA